MHDRYGSYGNIKWGGLQIGGFCLVVVELVGGGSGTNKAIQYILIFIYIFKRSGVAGVVLKRALSLIN